jgi:hypothetical protein
MLYTADTVGFITYYASNQQLLWLHTLVPKQVQSAYAAGIKRFVDKTLHS